jgi:hypothetical protein
VAQPILYTEVSLPLSQHTATLFYSEPVKSNQHFHMNLNIILPFLPSYTTVHTVDLLLCLRVRQQFKHVRKQCSLKISVLVTHQMTLLSNNTLPVATVTQRSSRHRHNSAVCLPGCLILSLYMIGPLPVHCTTSGQCLLTK